MDYYLEKVRTLNTSTDDDERREALDSLILGCNQNGPQSNRLVKEGLLKLVLKELEPYPSNNPVWQDDSAPDGSHPSFWLAFDVLTNLCKWDECREELVNGNVIPFLADLAKDESTYFGFEATEGLAYIIGRDEDNANSELIKARNGNIKKIIDVFNSALKGDGEFFGMRFGIYGRVLALERLSVSDANKVLLIPAIPGMLQVVKERRSNSNSVPLALKFLLHMTFLEETNAALRKESTLIPLMKEVSNDGMQSQDVRREASGIVFRLEASQQRANKPQPSPGAASVQSTVAATKAANSLVRRFTGQGKSAAPPAAQPSPAAAAPSAPGGGAVPSANVVTEPSHIMISYSWAQQDLIKILVKELRKLTDGTVNIWVDFESMDKNPTGNITDAMADAVEKATHILQIVPIMVAPGYSPRGWLGLLLGNALYVEAYDDPHIPPASAQVVEMLKNRGLNNVKLDGAALSAAKAPAPPPAVSTKSIAGVAFSAKLVSLTPDQVKDFFANKCGQPSLARTAASNNVTGRVLAVVFDTHIRGGPAVDLLSKLTGAQAAQACEVIFALAELAQQS